MSASGAYEISSQHFVTKTTDQGTHKSYADIHLSTSTSLDNWSPTSSTRSTWTRLRHPSNFIHRCGLLCSRVCPKLILSASLAFVPGHIVDSTCSMPAIDAGKYWMLWISVMLTTRFTMGLKAPSPVGIGTEDFSCHQSVIPISALALDRQESRLFYLLLEHLHRGKSSEISVLEDFVTTLCNT